MSRVVADLGVSLEGVAAGHDQSLEFPMGERVGQRLHTWMFSDVGDNRAEVDAIVDAGAFIMGRNMFTAGRGAWDLDWQGWWGPEPPYHGPVFVLTHYPRADLVMAGGTTFHFVTDGPEAALERARAAAGERNVSIAGGASTINAYLSLGLLDELRLHIAPLTVGDGVRIFEGVDDLRLVPWSSRTTPSVTHVTWRRS